MKLRKIEDYEWSVKLWVAENFGWKPEEVDNMAVNDLAKLAELWNKKRKEEARKARISRRKK